MEKVKYEQIAKKGKRNKENGIVYNMNDVPVADMVERRFLLDFNEAQKEALFYCINSGYPIGAIAYTGLSAKRMWAVIDIIYEDMASDREHFNVRGIKEEDIWKATHTKLTDSQFVDVLKCLRFKIRILDEIQNAYMYDDIVFSLILEAAPYDKNFCKKVKQDMDLKEFCNMVNNYISKQEKKREARGKRIAFIDSQH